MAVYRQLDLRQLRGRRRGGERRHQQAACQLPSDKIHCEPPRRQRAVNCSKQNHEISVPFS
jgi:hypothetical protein